MEGIAEAHRTEQGMLEMDIGLGSVAEGDVAVEHTAVGDTVGLEIVVTGSAGVGKVVDIRRIHVLGIADTVELVGLAGLAGLVDIENSDEGQPLLLKQLSSDGG